MKAERYLPSIEQIIQQADRIGDEPMSDEESAEWFTQTVEDNQESWRRIQRERSESDGKDVSV